MITIIIMTYYIIYNNNNNSHNNNNTKMLAFSKSCRIIVYNNCKTISSMKSNNKK